MQPRFSAYLDLVRFFSALLVFLGHAAGMDWTGGFLWQLSAYGDTCVVVFFVLSGYVIAYVVDAKERDGRTYGVNRLARLWSVVIPALALTFVVDYFGTALAPHLYIDRPWYSGDHLWARYIASFLMLQEVWHIDYVPGINQPFWSLGYEAFYYLIFGLLAFYKGRRKILLLTGVLALGGPLIVVLFPVWMAGVLAYRSASAATLSRPAAAMLFVASAILLALSPWLRQAVGVQWMGQEIAGRYLDTIVFFLNLCAARRLFDGACALPGWLGGRIKAVASTTFVLYLFHRPLIQLFSYIGPDDAASWERRVLVIGATLVVVAVATPLCDRYQKVLRASLMRRSAPHPILATLAASAKKAVNPRLVR